MSETIGERLKRAREEKRLTIAQVVEQTRIRSHYLEALERDDLSASPSTAQARGFLRIYSDFLGLKSDAMPASVQPSERTLAYQPSASSSDVQVAPVQEAVSEPEPAKPNLLDNLRDRFTRRGDSTPIAPQAEVAPVEANPTPNPEPEPFVPIRYTEELPAAPESPIAEEVKPVEEPSLENVSAPVTKPSRRKTAATNSKTLPLPKTKKAKPRAVSSKTGDKRAVVKKKITQTPPARKKSRLKPVS